MAMSPRLLRPRASGTTVPQFSPLGYTRLWCVTEKSSGNVTVTAMSQSASSIVVKWWDGTFSSADATSGTPITKAAAGGRRVFEVFPGHLQVSLLFAPFGTFGSFDISGNELTEVRAEAVSLASQYGYYLPGTPFFQTTYYGGGFWSTPNGPYVPGAGQPGHISNNNLSAEALDQFYTDLDSGTGSLFVQGNPGIDADDPTIATAKGYTVFGSVPE